MDPENQCLVAEFASMSEADVGLRVLETADFTPETVSIVTHQQQQGMADVTRMENEHPASPPADGSVGMGGAVGGTLGAALGAATMIGPFMVVGPLVGIAAGVGAGGLLGATERWGVTEGDTRSYEQRVREGAVLIIITDRDRRLDEAERLLKTTGPTSLQRFER